MNFTFQNPTKLIFGKGNIAKLATQIPTDKKIMLTMGGGSIRKNGVYDQVIAALKNHEVVEFWGIEPNPTVESVREAVALARENKIDFIVAVGGGSVVDATKLITAAIPNENDPWDIVLNSSLITECVPYASVITLPATGSEMNSGAVISNKATDEKFAFYSTFPQFSILDPEATFSLPEYQRACGLADTFVHVMEQYLTKCGVSRLMDRWAEGILSSVVEVSPKVIAEPTNYDTMADYMLCATMALNYFIGMGVPQDWATHMIGHEVTALTGTTHGQTLAIILPAVMKVMSDEKKCKILQYAERVWGIKEGSEQERIDKAIECTRNYFNSLGLKSKLSEVGCTDEICAQIVERFKERGTKLGENSSMDYTKIAEVLAICK
ncbi:MAG: iron-containing alcohol dehydrogenase [Rikenellaceae bacterium]